MTKQIARKVCYGCMEQLDIRHEDFVARAYYSLSKQPDKALVHYFHMECHDHHTTD